MAYASLQSLGPLAPAAGPIGSRIQRRIQRRSVTQRRPALQTRSMSNQEQWKPQSKDVTTTSRRDAILFMTAMSFAATTNLSAHAAETEVKTASVRQQIMEKLEMLREMVGLSKPESKDTKDKEKAPAAKDKTSLVKEKAPKPKEKKPQKPPPPAASEKEKIAQKEEEKPRHQPSAKSKDETPKPPNPLNDSAKPLVNSVLPKLFE